MGLFSWIGRLFGRKPAGDVIQQMVAALGSASWYYQRDGQRVGPFSLAQLQQMLQAGLLRMNDRVQHQGATTWVSLASVLPAAPAVTSPAPAAPTPAPIAPAASPVKPARQPTPADEWWCTKDGKLRSGPFTHSQLQSMAQAGLLSPEMMTLRKGTTTWAPLSSVVNFAPTERPPAFTSLQGIAAASTEPPLPVLELADPPRPAAPVQAAPTQTGRLDLNAGDFLPIARDDLKEQAHSVQRMGPWFGRRDVIPPADDPRTKLIDRGLVSNGLLTPEQLVEIHQVGAQMEQVRPTIMSIQHQAARTGAAAVEEDRARRARLKEEKKAESARKQKEHAEAVAQRRLHDIVFLGRGVSRGLGERSSDAAKLEAQGLPVLATPAELAAALGLPIPRLRWLAFHAEVATRTHYVHFTVPKKSGGLRTLSAPHKTLAAAQQWILQHIVSKLSAEPAAHGFLAGKSILTNAAPHVGQAVVINLDLENFFPTINFARVRSVFHRAGYSQAVATILALLCTECPRRTVQYDGKTYHVATGPRGLPQGACTSPGLSNQVARRLDRRLSGLARKLGLNYTRYADDLSISGPLPVPVTAKDGSPPAADQQRQHGIGYVLGRVRHIVQEEGFRINQKKSRVLRQSTAQLVTGVVVNRQPSLARKELRRLRALLHRARHEGLEQQNRTGRKHFRAWLEGKIAYVAMIRPELGASMKAQLSQLS